VQSAAQNSWEAFYQRELFEREKFLFPPFCHALKLTCRSATSESARKKADKLIGKIKDSTLRVHIDGPTPSMHERVANKYQWQLILKARQRNELIKAIELLPAGWSHDIDPQTLL